MSAAAQPPLTQIASRDNELLKQLRQLVQHNTAYRKQGRYWVEGEHLCQAALQRGLHPELAVYAEAAWETVPPRWRAASRKNVVLKDALFDDLSGLPSAARMAFVLALPAETGPRPGAAAVVLDQLQDAGNVGAILRSAAALGFQQVLALKGTAALWSGKVLRAGMGAHFGLHLAEGLEVEQVSQLGLPLLATSSHRGLWLHQQALPWPCAWVFGHEGQGVQDALLTQATATVRIVQPGGEESLNVAAAAAICLHASAVAQHRD